MIQNAKILLALVTLIVHKTEVWLLNLKSTTISRELYRLIRLSDLSNLKPPKEAYNKNVANAKFSKVSIDSLSYLSKLKP